MLITVKEPVVRHFTKSTLRHDDEESFWFGGGNDLQVPPPRKRLMKTLKMFLGGAVKRYII